MDSDITKTQPLTHAGSVLPLTGWEFVGRERRGEPGGTGRSGHAGHLTGCGGRLWRERWLNGSDVGRLQGTAEVGHIRTGVLVTDRTDRYHSGPIFTLRHRPSRITRFILCGLIFTQTSQIDAFLMNQTSQHVYN